MFKKLEEAFIRVMGPEAINILKQADTGIRVVTVGGDQLTGKSTLSKILASKLHATYLSAGTVFRMTAKEKGVSVGELSRLAQSDKDIDVRIEYATCKAIMEGVKDTPAPLSSTIVIEGRNPAVMAAYCRRILGKKDVLSMYLSCSPRVQARRFLTREVDKAATDRLEMYLGLQTFSSLQEVGASMLKYAETPEGKSVAHAVRMFVDNQYRDDDDRARFLSLYSFPPSLDYRYKPLYDVVLDTTDSTPESTLQEALAFLAGHPVGHAAIEHAARASATLLQHAEQTKEFQKHVAATHGAAVASSSTSTSSPSNADVLLKSKL